VSNQGSCFSTFGVKPREAVDQKGLVKVYSGLEADREKDRHARMAKKVLQICTNHPDLIHNVD
jgi:hypothetical protein